MKSNFVLRTIVGVAMVAAPVVIGVGTASTASASASKCAYYLVADDSNDTNVCTYVTGSHTFVNAVSVEVSDADSTPSTDDWFPTIGGCEVQVGWQDINNSGNVDQDDWTGDLSCATVKSQGGHAFSEDENVDAGAVCGDLNFTTYNQFVGGSGCVIIDS